MALARTLSRLGLDGAGGLWWCSADFTGKGTQDLGNESPENKIWYESG
jgi:hypothetical protein